MVETLQILPVILLIVPVGALLVLGLIILIRPVAVIRRIWFNGVFLPMILANPLIILETQRGSANNALSFWRIGLILVADLLLVVWVVATFRGWQIYGLASQEIEKNLTLSLEAEGFEVAVQDGEKDLPGGRVLTGRQITVVSPQGTAQLWLTEKSNEVILRAESKAGFVLLNQVLPDLRKLAPIYDFKQHAMGLLYLVLAVVFAVLSWIILFEPRFILVE